MFATVVTEFEYQKLKNAHNLLQQKVDKMEEKFTLKLWEKENEIMQLKVTNVEFQKRIDEAFEKISKFNEMLEVRMMTFEPEHPMLNTDQFSTGINGECANVAAATAEVQQLGKVEQHEVEEGHQQQQRAVLEQQQELLLSISGGEVDQQQQQQMITTAQLLALGIEGAQHHGAAHVEAAAAVESITGQFDREDSTSDKSREFYKCAHCPETFRWKSVLIRHERIHTGERPFQCNKCGKEFSRVSTLNIHQRIHSGEKPCECHFCGVRFTQDGQLKTHIRIHTGERPYKCTYCGHKFARAGNLKTHLRLHTGEKPFMCSHCGKQFTQSSQLQIHLHVHYRKHKCEFCQKTFAKEDQLKNHTTNTHQQQPQQQQNGMNLLTKMI